MNYYYASLLLIFFVIGYMIVRDSNVAVFLILNFKLFLIRIERIKFLIIFHPKNPITNFIMTQRYKKIAAQLAKDNSKTVHSD